MMDTSGLVEGNARLRTLGLTLSLACVIAYCGGCASIDREHINNHVSYFERMAERMPDGGQLRLRSQYDGVSANYFGPGGRDSHWVELKRAHYEPAFTENGEVTKARLSLTFASHVSVCAKVDLSVLAEFWRDGKLVQVSSIFHPVPNVPESEGSYDKVISFDVETKTKGALAGTYELRLRHDVLDTCGGYDVGGSATFWIP